MLDVIGALVVVCGMVGLVLALPALAWWDWAARSRGSSRVRVGSEEGQR